MDKVTMVFFYSLNDEVMANIQAMKPHAINCGAGIIPPLLLLSLLSFPPSSLLSSFSVGGGDGEGQRNLVPPSIEEGTRDNWCSQIQDGG